MRLLLAAVLMLAAGAALAARRPASSSLPFTAQDMQPGAWDDNWQEAAGIPLDAMPTLDDGQEARNVAAFLAMIHAAEGTAAEGGYGALFGWPGIPGRSFDPYTVSGHPKQFFTFTDKAGRVQRTS